jgi:hypothetical protein
MKKTMITLLIAVATAFGLTAATAKDKRGGKEKEAKGTIANQNHPPNGHGKNNKAAKVKHGNYRDRYHENNPVKGGQLKKKGGGKKGGEEVRKPTTPGSTQPVPVQLPTDPKVKLPVPVTLPTPTPGPLPGSTDPGAGLPGIR